ncbi:pyridoxal-phosphate dependent enzyme [Curtobacterium flaccumfaciens]|uniref:pyridoxal-phosphate dependent enzyme n=1 Tax=Curtobacterium flaccumfaciens TaxID=2035 RepID=UPI00160492D3|nr:pyridoxal-phosphate dependent enzyme [Curtobacterium flaccumfaciens]MBB1195622.1 pyridoxal-phosphate dependent enzyme [Curtobacterium flaccumfaciens]
MSDRWYNALAGRSIGFPTEDHSERSSVGVSRRARRNDSDRLKINTPKALVRQNLPLETWIQVPDSIRAAYREWRPTPLLRAHRLEAEIGATSPLYFKDETRNIAGSHKYLTALAQAYYHAQSGATALVTSTAAGQWGTAVAAAAQRFGLRCRIYMVPDSYYGKPGRRVAMEMLGAEVLPAPPDSSGRTSLSAAMTHAVQEAASSEDFRWVLGGSEPFAILHTTTIGIEAVEQLKAAEGPEAVDRAVLIGYLGGGKNLLGLGLPFWKEGSSISIRSIESTAYPLLTRGAYRFDETDGSGSSPRAAMYTLGYDHVGSQIQAEGMRYHAAPRLVSELLRRGDIEAAAYDEPEVFESAQRFFRSEGVLPSAESAYAVHDACLQATDEVNRGRPVVFCLSDHGYYDANAYRAWLDGELAPRVSALPSRGPAVASTV